MNIIDISMFDTFQLKLAQEQEGKIYLCTFQMHPQFTRVCERDS